MRPSPRRTRSWFLHRCLCFSLSSALLWTNLFFAMASTVSAAPAAGADELGPAYDRIRKLQQLLDQSLFDTEALLDSQDYDADLLVEFVESQIAYQAYSGALRGPEGTLVSRSGNALDQCLLLAKLLNDAGYDSRIVRGTLTREQAQDLIENSKGERAWPLAFGEKAKAEEALGLFRSEGSQSENERFEATMGQARSKSEQRYKQLRDLGQAVSSAISGKLPDLTSETFGVELVTEQQDYFWVEYRAEASGGWKAAHPAFAGDEPTPLKATEYFKDEIPPALQHRVRYQAFIETRLGSESSVKPLMAAWERPAANAAFRPQSLMLMPVAKFEEDGQFSLEEGIASAKFYALYLNGVLAPGANVFTLDGLVGPPDALTGAGEFIANVSGKGKQAADLLGEVGSSDTTPRPGGITRVWFEYTLIAPGGSEKTIRRDVVSTLPDGQRLVSGSPVADSEFEEEAKLAFVQSRNLLVATGPVSPAFSMSQLLTNAATASEAVMKLRELERAGKLEASSDALKDLTPVPDVQALNFLAIANGSTGFRREGVDYLASPMVVTFNKGVTRSADELRQFEQTDIVFNARRSFDVENGKVVPTPQHAALRGIWDTYLETQSASLRGAPVAVKSAFGILDTPQSKLQYFGPEDGDDLARAGLDKVSLQLARQELDSGYGLVIPAEFEAGSAAWWRIDPSTGTATGMMVGAGGYGGATVAEFLVVLSITIATLLLYWSYYNCFKTEAGIALFCCLVDSWLTGFVVGALAFLIATLIGTGVAAGAAAMGAATAEAEMVSAIIGLFVLDVPSTFVSFTDFRLNACGRVTGSG